MLEKNTVPKDKCTSVFIATLFTIAKAWNQPKCPSTEECIRRYHTHTHTHTENQPKCPSTEECIRRYHTRTHTNKATATTALSAWLGGIALLLVCF